MVLFDFKVSAFIRRPKEDKHMLATAVFFWLGGLTLGDGQSSIITISIIYYHVNQVYQCLSCKQIWTSMAGSTLWRPSILKAQMRVHVTKHQLFPWNA